MVYIFLFIFGAIFGSFLNVCIHRIPRGKSVVKPGSRCPKCGHVLSWHENMPILSFMLLKGRCRKCRLKISYVYPLVEVITGIVLVLIFMHFGVSVKTVIYFVFFSALIIATFIDFERNEIPDVISLPGIGLGLILSFIFPGLMTEKSRLFALLVSSLGVVAGGGSLYILGFLGEIVFKKEAMGGGDIKLLAMIGAFLGWKAALLTFFIAPFLGAGTGLFLKIKEGRERIPYGPYLSLAALVSILWGNDILRILFRV